VIGFRGRGILDADRGVVGAEAREREDREGVEGIGRERGTEATVLRDDEKVG
jgi:hypothetical protein